MYVWVGVYFFPCPHVSVPVQRESRTLDQIPLPLKEELLQGKKGLNSSQKEELPILVSMRHTQECRFYTTSFYILCPGLAGQYDQ